LLDASDADGISAIAEDGSESACSVMLLHCVRLDPSRAVRSTLTVQFTTCSMEAGETGCTTAYRGCCSTSGKPDCSLHAARRLSEPSGAPLTAANIRLGQEADSPQKTSS
jgi:hypothetical protein